MRLLLNREEHVVDEDPAVVADDQNLESPAENSIAVRRQHFPVEGNDIAQPTSVFRSAKPVAVVPDILVVRSKDALFERVIPSRFAHADIVLTLRYPKFRDLLPAAAGIGLMPNGNITIGK